MWCLVRRELMLLSIAHSYCYYKMSLVLWMEGCLTLYFFLGVVWHVSWSECFPTRFNGSAHLVNWIGWAGPGSLGWILYCIKWAIILDPGPTLILNPSEAGPWVPLLEKLDGWVEFENVWLLNIKYQISTEDNYQPCILKDRKILNGPKINC